MRIGELCMQVSPLDNLQRIGIEVELERAYNSYYFENYGLDQWQCEHDGSLRNGGIELISPVLTMEEAEAQVPRLYDMIGAAGGVGTIRTGIHVHFDMRHRTLVEVAAICTAYALLEPVLYSMLPEDREQCIYCVPWYRAPDEAMLLKECLDLGEDRSEIRRQLEYHAVKYTGLNIGSLRIHGTLEFRQAPTFASAKDLMLWIKTLEAVVTMGDALGTPEAVLRAVQKEGLDALWDDAGELATKYDSYYCAEILGGDSELTWEAPMLELDEEGIVTEDVIHITEDDPLEQILRANIEPSRPSLYDLVERTPRPAPRVSAGVSAQVSGRTITTSDTFSWSDQLAVIDDNF